MRAPADHSHSYQSVLALVQYRACWHCLRKGQLFTRPLQDIRGTYWAHRRPRWSPLARSVVTADCAGLRDCAGHGGRTDGSGRGRHSQDGVTVTRRRLYKKKRGKKDSLRLPIPPALLHTGRVTMSYTVYNSRCMDTVLSPLPIDTAILNCTCGCADYPPWIIQRSLGWLKSVALSLPCERRLVGLRREHEATAANCAAAPRLRGWPMPATRRQK